MDTDNNILDNQTKVDETSTGGCYQDKVETSSNLGICVPSYLVDSEEARQIQMVLQLSDDEIRDIVANVSPELYNHELINK